MGFELTGIAVDENDRSRVDSTTVRRLVDDLFSQNETHEDFDTIELPDGSGVSGCFSELNEPENCKFFSLKLHGLTEPQLDFALQIARALDMYLVDSGSGKKFYFTRADQDERLSPKMRKPSRCFVFCPTAADLLREINEGFKAFVAIKDRLVKPSDHSTPGPGQWVSRPVSTPDSED